MIVAKFKDKILYKLDKYYLEKRGFLRLRLIKRAFGPIGEVESEHLMSMVDNRWFNYVCRGAELDGKSEGLGTAAIHLRLMVLEKDFSNMEEMREAIGNVADFMDRDSEYLRTVMRKWHDDKFLKREGIYSYEF